MPNSSKIEEFTDKIKKKEAFSFIKRGDGEEFCMSGMVGENCDHHPYSPELGQKLKDAYAYFATREDCFVPLFDDQVYFNSLLHRVDNNNSKVHDFYKAISEDDRNKIYVGPARLSLVAKMLKAKHIVVPEINAFSEYDRILEEIKQSVGDDENSIVMFSAGMMSKSLAHETLVFSHYTTCLDLGSAFDPIVRATRTEQVNQAYMLGLYSDLIVNI